MIKVIHIIVDLDVGGAETMLRKLVEEQRRSTNIQHVIVSLTTVGPVGQRLQRQGVKVVGLNFQGFWGSIVAACRLFVLLRKEKPDIVQTWMYHADFIGGILSFLAGRRNVIWGVRTTQVRSGLKRMTKFLRSVCALLSYIIPRMIVCAAEVSKRAHIEAGYSEKKMLVIPNGFDVKGLPASREEVLAFRNALGIGNNSKIIGSVGRYNWSKDYNNFIDAVALLRETYSDIQVLMIGRGLENENAEILRSLKERNLLEGIFLLGERKDVPLCMAAMDVFCVHSQNEGFPNVLGEAMAIGSLCVTTDVGDAPYLLGDAGFIVPPRDSFSLAEALSAALSLERPVADSLKVAAQKRVQSYFDIEVVAARFEDLYREVLRKEN